MDDNTQLMNKKFMKNLEKYFDSWLRNSLFFSLTPFIAIGFFLLFNIFFRVVPFGEFFTKYSMVFVVALCLSFFFFLIGMSGYVKRKWIYNSVRNGTIIIKETKIIKFVIHVGYSSSKKYIKDKKFRYMHSSSRYYDSLNMYFLTSDGERKYKSKKYLNGDVVLVGDDVTLYDRQGPNTWLTIKGKRFSIGDEIDVYVDSRHKRNYIMDVVYANKL